ncbi:MAG: hypothetical protein A2X23_01965 [Chloroflexi bacterium GWC2_73_18]|nr:MAG: hypothetical protein A2X23_01965 [Chloroflexi bacterium GWC2_73_18]
MKRRLLVLVAVAALLGAAVLPTAATAKSPPRFQRIDISGLGLKFMPVSLGTDRQVSVVLELAAEPVAVRQGEALRQGRQLSKAEREAIRAALRSSQDKLKAGVAAAGGRVLRQFQDAYNGMTVRIPAAKVGALADLAGVRAVHAVKQVYLDNERGVQYIGTPAAWQDLGATGAGVTIGVIDTGIDYYHANLGGSGNPADFAADDGLTIGTPAFPNAKVTGGTDFVGDAYDAGSDDPAINTPQPDPDPLDCNGHGSHVAGTAAGVGILSSGSPFGGPYNGATFSGNSFLIGPGVAPQATLRAYRVFGCEGSATNDIVVAAINQAVIDGVDVINMSLGSPFGRNTDIDSVASNNAALAGVMVVASSGNNGASAYLAGSPSVASRALSVAAVDASFPTLPAASIDVDSIVLANNNDGPLPVGPATVLVLSNGAGGIGLGCDPAEYAGAAGKIVVSMRGVCARVDRATNGQAAGAVAVIMVNNTSGYPPFEGPIAGVTIPFLGALQAHGPALQAANGTTHTISATTIANPNYKKLASFTSGGPRNGDSAAKPDVTAPGVSLFSTNAGTGNGGIFISGTSMSSPHTAGVAAAILSAHPSWDPEHVKAAIVNTADPSTSQIVNYHVRLAGSGLVQPRKAADTVAYATTGGGAASLSFGSEALAGGYSETQTVTLHNTSGSLITYNVAAAFQSSASLGATASVSPATVPVAAGGTAAVDVTLSLSAGAVAALPPATLGASGPGGLFTAHGAVTATPTIGGAGIYSLRVPFVLAPRGLSDITAGAKAPYTQANGIARSSVLLSNSGIHAGDADVYAWGLSDAAEGFAKVDVRHVGVQTLPGAAGGGAPSDRLLVFAINTYGSWSNAASAEFDVAIDTNNNGKTDFFVVGFDLGYITTGQFNGQMASFVITPAGNIVDAFYADAPMNGSTILLPLFASDLGLKWGNSDFNYRALGFDLETGDLDFVTGKGRFDSHKPAVSTGQFIGLGPSESDTLNLWVNRGKFASAPSMGWMVVALDDANGAVQSTTIPVGSLPPWP